MVEVPGVENTINEIASHSADFVSDKKRVRSLAGKKLSSLTKRSSLQPTYLSIDAA